MIEFYLLVYFPSTYLVSQISTLSCIICFICNGCNKHLLYYTYQVMLWFGDFQVTSGSGAIVLVKWYDNRPVTLASNFIGVGAVDDVRRWDKRSRSFVMVRRPEIVHRYNTSMGGVDKLDQLISLYRTFIKSRKWTLRMICHGVDFAVVNSWLEYKQDAVRSGMREKEMDDLLAFRLRIADSLVRANKPAQPSRKRGRPSSVELIPRDAPLVRRSAKEIRANSDILADGMDHMPEYDTKKEATRCKRSSCSGKTHVYCDKCNVHYCFVPGRNCFKMEHRQ